MGDSLTYSNSNILVMGLQGEQNELIVDQPTCMRMKLCKQATSHQNLELPSLDIVYGCMLAADTVPLDRVLFMEAVRRHLKYRMTQEAKDGDVFYPVSQKLVSGPGSYTALVDVLKPAGFVDGAFVEVVFEKY